MKKLSPKDSSVHPHNIFFNSNNNINTMKTKQKQNSMLLSMNIKYSKSNPKSKKYNEKRERGYYDRVKQKYNFYLKRNQNLRLLQNNSTLVKITSKDFLEQEKDNKEYTLSLLPFIPKKKINQKKAEELKKLQRDTVTIRRIEYSMKVKNDANKMKEKNLVKHIIVIQKWVRGFILRNFLSNVYDVEKIILEFFNHIKNYYIIKEKDFVADLYKNIINFLIKKYKIEIKVEKNDYLNKENNLNNDENDDKVNIENKIENNDENNNINNIENEIENNNENNIKNIIDNKIEINNENIIEKSGNERYIDDDSLIEYNNQRNNQKNNRKNNTNINNINILSFSSEDFSAKNNFKDNPKKSSGNIPFDLNESDIIHESIDNKKFEDSLVDKKNNDELFSTLKNEEVRDLFNAKHCDKLVEPNTALILNNISNNNEESLNRFSLNRKFIQEITSTNNNKKDDNIDKNMKRCVSENNMNINNNLLSSLNNNKETNKNDFKEKKTIDNKIFSIKNLLFKDDTSSKNNNEENCFKIPINDCMYITKMRIINKISSKFDDCIIIKQCKSEKKILPKIFDLYYQYNNEDIIINQPNIIENKEITSDNENNNSNDNKIINNSSSSFSLRSLLQLDKQNVNDEENNNNSNNINQNKNINTYQMSIEEIKEVKEEYEEEKDSELIDYNSVKKNNSCFSINQSFKNLNKHLINYDITSSSFQIKAKNFDKKNIFWIYLFEKQILFIIKPYIFNLLKQYWREKL